jgi:hypothetical protein
LEWSKRHLRELRIKKEELKMKIYMMVILANRGISAGSSKSSQSHQNFSLEFFASSDWSYPISRKSVRWEISANPTRRFICSKSSS